MGEGTRQAAVLRPHGAGYSSQLQKGYSFRRIINAGYANYINQGGAGPLRTRSRRATLLRERLGDSHGSRTCYNQPQSPTAQPCGDSHINVVGVDVVGMRISIQHQQPHPGMVIYREIAKNKEVGSEELWRGPALPTCKAPVRQ